MPVKTITVTEDAYEALKGLKDESESFSKAIMRISKKKSIREFAGAISNASAEMIKASIRSFRRRQARGHAERIKQIVSALEGRNGSS